MPEAMESPGRHCKACGQWKTAEHFTPSRACLNGLLPQCKVCLNAARRARRLSDPAYRERVNAAGEAWKAANPEKHSATLANCHQAKKGDPAYRARRRRNQDRHRARKHQANGHATVAQIAARWAMWGGRCYLCGAVATETDHVKPLARGGSDWPSNLRPACGPCNRRKSFTWTGPAAPGSAGVCAAAVR